MFCCMETPWTNPHDSYQRQTSDGLSSYPGTRRFVQTGGNALASPPYHHHASPSYHGGGGGGQLVSVTVPPGISPGQAIQVAAPDGSGRTMTTTVPYGVTTGSTFTVEFPPSGLVSPVPSSVASSMIVGPPTTVSAAEPAKIDYSGMHTMPPPASAPYTPTVNAATLEAEPFAQAVPVNAAPGATTISAAPYAAAAAAPVLASPYGADSNNRRQSMMRVQVPPGARAGSTIHVQVPGQNRVIATQVPFGVSEFDVAYDDDSNSSSNTSYSPPPTNPHRPGERTLLVRVPPGTPPGTTLHVQVPNEPGRVLAATVPPNVQEFHVSYMPNSQGNAPIVPANSVQNRGNQNYGNQYNPQTQRSTASSNGFGSVFLPLLGGAAMGAAGMSMYDHYAHTGASENYNNDGYGGDYDGGGDDYGGASDYYDGGGGDFDFGDF